MCGEIKVEVKLRRDGSMYDINNSTTKRNGVHADSHGAHVCCVLAQGLGVLENRVIFSLFWQRKLYICTIQKFGVDKMFSCLKDVLHLFDQKYS